jgi:hypothetical protein
VLDAVPFATKLAADPNFKKASGLFIADFITSAEARTQPGRAQRLQDEMKAVSQAVFEVGIALSNGLNCHGLDLKATPQLIPLVDPTKVYLWAMSADMHFEGFDWNGAAGVRVQTTGFRFIVLFNFEAAEQKLRDMNIVGHQ